MIFYRFGSNPKRAAAEEFDGTGGLLGAGRWHILGKRVTYAATHEALALLEKLVHRPVGGPATYTLYYADVPDDLVEWLPLEQLPRDWRSVYPPISTQSLGDAWITSKRSLVLCVPSILINGTDSRNCLLNPEHPGFPDVKLSGQPILSVDFRFD